MVQLDTSIMSSCLAAKPLSSVMHGLGWQIVMIIICRTHVNGYNQQHELIHTVNRHALKRIEQSAQKSVSQAGHKVLDVPIDKLVLLCDHPEGQNTIQDNYKSKLFVMKLKHWYLNVYTIKPLNGKAPM